MEPIAIVGLGCRFPGASNPESFWQLLRDGVDAIVEVPAERWDIDALYDPNPKTPGKMSTRWGGFIGQADQFDAGFFGIAPGEAERMDPQHRLVLEVAWEALEDAGLAPDSLAGSAAGVFIGISHSDYDRIIYRDHSRLNGFNGTGSYHSIAPNRISFLLDLRGPSMTIDTACSSSLVAVHVACQSLRLEESSLAVVGGVNLNLSPEETIALSKARALAPDGRCKTFDARANGYVRGEGCGVVILKRLADAVRDQDMIRAIIRGSAVNQDGLSNGLTAPSALAQQAVIGTALRNAGVSPADISYVEAHGTGTRLGDPIEMKSLKAVLLQDRPSSQPCWIGSVKTNIGHLEAAAGIAGLIKAVLALQHREIPPHLHLQQLNSFISLEGTPLRIPGERHPWITPANRRLAGVSAFGFGGTNCHVILEEAARPDAARSEIERPVHVLTLSARTAQALLELAARYRTYLATHREVPLADVCFTANTGRSPGEHRLAVVGESSGQMCAALDAFTSTQPAAERSRRRPSGRKRPKLAVLCAGEGDPIGVGSQLYNTQPTFRRTLDRCEAIVRSRLEVSVLGALYPTSATPFSVDDPVARHLSLFSLEYAVATLWKSWGVHGDGLFGCGLGEYVAACLSGVFSLEDALSLVAARARPLTAVPDSDGFRRIAAEVRYSPPCIPMISRLTGEWSTGDVAKPDYWCVAGREPASFAASMGSLLRAGYSVFLDLSPEATLLNMGRRCLPPDSSVWLSSLHKGESDWEALLPALGTLFTNGVAVDWSGFDRDYLRQRAVLPTYPFQRQRYWMEL